MAGRRNMRLPEARPGAVKTLHGAPRGAASLSPQGRAMLRQSVDFAGRHVALHPPAVGGIRK